MAIKLEEKLVILSMCWLLYAGTDKLICLIIIIYVSRPTETRFRLRFWRQNCQISWFQPGFGYGRNSHFGFGLVSVTAVTRNLVSA